MLHTPSCYPPQHASLTTVLMPSYPVTNQKSYTTPHPHKCVTNSSLSPKSLCHSSHCVSSPTMLPSPPGYLHLTVLPNPSQYVTNNTMLPPLPNIAQPTMLPTPICYSTYMLLIPWCHPHQHDEPDASISLIKLVKSSWLNQLHRSDQQALVHFIYSTWAD